MLSIWVVPLCIAGIGGALALVVWLLDGDHQAFLETYFIHFNGFFVGGSAYMLLVFVFSYKAGIILDINTLFGRYCVDNSAYQDALRFSQHKRIAFVCIAGTTIVGGVSLYVNGYPLKGFGKFAMIIGTFSIYSVAGYGLKFCPFAGRTGPQWFSFFHRASRHRAFAI